MAGADLRRRACVTASALTLPFYSMAFTPVSPVTTTWMRPAAWSSSAGGCPL